MGAKGPLRASGRRPNRHARPDGDFDGTELSTAGTERLGRLVRDFQDRRRALRRDLLLSDKLDEKLLGRMFVANRPLTAAFDPRYRHLAAYHSSFGEAFGNARGRGFVRAWLGQA